MNVPTQIQDMIDSGALFAVNHSGGKDSQAMLVALRRIVPAEQLLVVHADLGSVEWAGTRAIVEEYAADLPVVIAQAYRKDGSDRTFLNMVDDKAARLPDVSPWPSPKQRQCTSDLKRGPIEREIRRYLKANPRFNGMVVNCVGVRAGESESRAKANPLQKNEKNSKAGRTWIDWLPIFEMTTLEVFATIADAGERLHDCYQEGMTRMSCSFCIMASNADLELAARLRPELLVQYAVREKAYGFTFRMDRRGLDEFVATPAEALPALAEI